MKKYSFLINRPLTLAVGLAILVLTVVFSPFASAWTGVSANDTDSPDAPSVSATYGVYLNNQRLLPDEDIESQDFFGHSVSISGNTMVVGAPGDDVGSNDDQGSTYVFIRSGETWTKQARLTASDGAAGDSFGWSVAIAGDTIIVGAPYDNIGSLSDMGSAYIFVRSGTTWSQQGSKLVNTSDYTGDTLGGEYFGWSVGIHFDGTTMRSIVGAKDDKTRNNGLTAREGSATAYSRSGSTWSQIGQKMKPDNSLPDLANPLFGNAVDIDGTTVIIGSPNFFSSTHGAAFIYTAGSTAPLRQLTVTSPMNLPLGDKVALENATAVVATTSTFGKVFTSTFSGSLWGDPAEITASGSALGSIGASVAISGDTILTGRQNTGGRGSAAVFRKILGAWTYSTELFSFDRAPTGMSGIDGLGYSVAVDKHILVAGAISDFQGQGPGHGSALVFLNTFPRAFDSEANGASNISIFRPSNNTWYVCGPPSPASYTVPFFHCLSSSPTTATQFGASGDKLTPADFDGDGKMDIAIYRPSDQNWYILNSGTGQVSYIYYGLSTDTPMPNHFDDDKLADVAHYRTSNSTWYWKKSTDGQSVSYQLGTSGDKPVIADFDGDGRGELTVFRPSNGTWYWYNIVTQQSGSQYYGTSGDIPTPGDFDGDLKTDIAVYRPSTQYWYRINSSTGSAISPVQFGASGDIPAVGDYDADGESDIAVFRPGSTNGTFYVLESRAVQTVTTVYGLTADKPIAAAFNQ